MFNDLSQVLVVLIIFGTIYKVFELFVCRQERMKLIDKITEIGSVNINGLVDRMKWPTRRPAKGMWPLRFGLLAVGIGLGFLVALIILGLATNQGYYTDKRSYNWELPEIIYTSCLCIFGGIGLVTSYLIERKERKSLKDTDNDE